MEDLMKLLIPTTLALAALATITTSAPAAAQQDRGPIQYALVVGANIGGVGQESLQYAERDAANVADVLQSLGRYPADKIFRLSQPTPGELRLALKRLTIKLKAHERAGEQTAVLFYYSGHARANSLNLGKDELELSSLRAELEALPSTLTVVILDACQSGSFSRIKGVAGAGDFSVNSVANLNATGIAVMASSSASELSQESERLGASYFTHYLVVALRGAGDDNSDGRVTLDEAYRYAYNRTLAATAKTAVGKQHVTLETALRGKGEIALTYPAAMKSAMIIPKNAEGDYLVQAATSGAVLAEVVKVKDRSVRLALAPGAYRVVVRTSATAKECRHTVAPGQTSQFAEQRCKTISIEDTVSKGYHERRPWAIEFANGFLYGREDAFTSRLEDFGYESNRDGDAELALEFTLYRHASQHVWIGLSALTLASNSYRRDGDTEIQEYSWSSFGFLASLLYERPIAHYKSGNPALIPFVEGAAGLTRSSTQLSVGLRDDNKVDYGFAVSAAAGVQWMFVPGFGLFAKGRYAAAPTINNLLGDTHDVGGTAFTFGVRGTIRGQ